MAAGFLFAAAGFLAAFFWVLLAACFIAKGLLATFFATFFSDFWAAGSFFGVFGFLNDNNFPCFIILKGKNVQIRTQL